MLDLPQVAQVQHASVPLPLIHPMCWFNTYVYFQTQLSVPHIPLPALGKKDRCCCSTISLCLDIGGVIEMAILKRGKVWKTMIHPEVFRSCSQPMSYTLSKYIDKYQIISDNLRTIEWPSLPASVPYLTCS